MVVCLGARREEKLKELVDTINGGDQGKAIFRVTDVTKRDDLVELVKHAETEFGKPVDVLINNAGVMPLSFMRNLHQDEWDRMVDVNIKVCSLYRTNIYIYIVGAECYGFIGVGST